MSAVSPKFFALQEHQSLVGKGFTFTVSALPDTRTRTSGHRVKYERDVSCCARALACVLVATFPCCCNWLWGMDYKELNENHTMCTGGKEIKSGLIAQAVFLQINGYGTFEG